MELSLGSWELTSVLHPDCTHSQALVPGEMLAHLNNILLTKNVRVVPDLKAKLKKNKNTLSI